MSSEGKFPRMPKPKDKSKGVSVTVGEVSLKPTREAIWEEEDDTYHAHAKKRPEPSLLSRVGAAMAGAASKVTKPWARLTGEEDEDE